MNKKEISLGIVGIVIGVIFTLLFSSISARSRSMMRLYNYWPTSEWSGIMMNNIDEHFIEQMIPHHDSAIAMANIALTKATHPEIKTLANNIIESQSKEIKDMQGWYKDWFSRDVNNGDTYSMMGGMMSQGGMHMVGRQENDTQALENAVDFDKTFIENMIPHHQLAVMMAQMLKAGTNRPEMLTLANNIIESQSKEIQEMQDWYKIWYK